MASYSKITFSEMHSLDLHLNSVLSSLIFLKNCSFGKTPEYIQIVDNALDRIKKAKKICNDFLSF